MALGGIDFNGNLGSFLTLIGAVSGAIVSIINAIKSRSASIKTNDKLDSASNKLDNIHDSTNGTLVGVQSELDQLKTRFEALEYRNRELLNRINKLTGKLKYGDE